MLVQNTLVQGQHEFFKKKPTNVVTIKSLATGQIMKVYLDEPTYLGVNKEGINVTAYMGHFYEEEFMVTQPDGYEITGLPFMYPYLYGDPMGITIVIDTENHSVICRNGIDTDPVDLVSSPIFVPLIDSQDPNDTSRNAVEYTFTPFDDDTGLIDNPTQPIDPEVVQPAQPVTPIGGGAESGPAT